MLPITGQEYGCDGGYIACREDLAHAAVGLVVHALPALVLDDVALRVEFGEIERIEQEAHAVGLEPQRGFEVVRRHGLVVVV